MKSIVYLLLATTLILSCKKEGNHYNPNGNNTIVYESDYMYPYKFKPLSSGNRFIIEYHLDVYQDILGQIAYSANGSKTDGEADWFKNLTVSNLKLSDEIKIKLTDSDLNFSNDLTNCKLIYSYYPIDNSGKKTRLLATFNGYNSSDKTVSLISTGNDLSSLFQENSSGTLYLDFSFSKSATADNYANLTYLIAFNYDYSYTGMASAKKKK
ncbi:MAG: hypothetical protein M9916_05220 [Crocinitomicaceae bacterium]|nr:hypothetical protein [Crocinitomicaceae bacterium]